MIYESSPVGNEISCVMHGIDREILADNGKLKEILLAALKEDNFAILNVAEHKFEPEGYTIMVLLAESHATIHTYPEYGSLYFQLYSCRGLGDGRKTFEFLKEKLKPSSVDFEEKKVVVKQEQ